MAANDGAENGSKTVTINHLPSMNRVKMPASTDHSVSNGFQFLILAFMGFQNALHTIFMRYSRSREVEHMFMTSASVFWMEVIKLVICLVVVTCDHGSVAKAISTIRKTTLDHPTDTLKVCIPSFVYTISNNLYFVAATHLDAATFAVTTQLKLITTAIFSVLILRKSLSRFQWLSLFILFAGVSVVQWSNSSTSSTPKPTKAQNDPPATQRTSAASRQFFGFVVAIVASALAGFAGVYFEKILKSRDPKSSAGGVTVWMRNVQLAVSSVPIALVTAYIEDGPTVRKYGLTYGFDSVVWLTVCWCSIGGLAVAVCIKYTDNIRKNFSTSAGIVLSTIISMFVFNFRPSVYFILGAAMVIGAIFMYTKHTVPVEVVADKEDKERPKLLETSETGYANGKVQLIRAG